MSTDNEHSLVKRRAWYWTIGYVLLFPIAVMMAAASCMMFDCPRMTVPLGLFIILLFCCIPLSIPVSWYLIWSRYHSGNYERCRFYCKLPLLTVVAVFILNAIVQTLFLPS